MLLYLKHIIKYSLLIFLMLTLSALLALQSMKLTGYLFYLPFSQTKDWVLWITPLATFAFLVLLPLSLYLLGTFLASRIKKEKLVFLSLKLPIVILIALTIFSMIGVKLVTSFRSDMDFISLLADYGDYQQAYQKAAARVEEGDVDAKFLIGKMYLYGLGVNQDTNQGLGWLEDAASNGHAEAAYLVGNLWHEGFKTLPRDYKKTVKWYQKAVTNGNAYAANDLAVLYGRGQGVEKNLAKEFELYQLAASKGDALAMYNIGLNYTKNYPKKDYVVASRWFKKSIAALPDNNVCAYNDLGMLYAAGLGVIQDTAESKNLLKKAGQQLLAEYNEDILKEAHLEKNEQADNPIPVFVAYQYEQAIKSKNQIEIEKNYSKGTIKIAKSMSKQIVTTCWD